MSRVRDRTSRRRRKRGLIDVFALGLLGIFGVAVLLLPGLLVELPPSIVLLAYLCATAAAIPTIASLSELCTAMPRSGGGYFFIDRSMGPAAGWIGGLASWLVYAAECVLILVSIGVIATAVFGLPVEAVAIGLLVALGGFQVARLRRLARPRRAVASLVLGAVATFVVLESVGLGFVTLELTTWFEVVPSLASGTAGLATVTGLFFVCFAGLIGLGSIAEHVEEPETDIPRGMMLALAASAIAFGFVMLVIQQGALPGQGRFDAATVGLAAVIVLAVVAAAYDRLGSSTRLTHQMAADHSLPATFGGDEDRSTASMSLLAIGVATVAGILFVDLGVVVRVASGLTLLVFGALNLAVIVMRESDIEYYRPDFKSPLYPWLQLAGVGVSAWLIWELGWVATASCAAVCALGLIAYVGHARSRVDRSGALYHVFARLGDRQSNGLDHELRGIISEKGLHDEDPYDHVIENATTMDLRHTLDFSEAIQTGARMLSREIDVDASEIAEALLDELELGLMPIYDGVAIPHHLFAELDDPTMLIMRIRVGARVSFDERKAHIRNRGQVFAAIFLLCPDRMNGGHLRMLSQLAARAERPEFLADWLEAGSAKGLKQLLSDGVSSDSGESHDDLLAVIDWEASEADGELGEGSSEELVDTLPARYVHRTDWLRSN